MGCVTVSLSNYGGRRMHSSGIGVGWVGRSWGKRMTVSGLRAKCWVVKGIRVVPSNMAGIITVGKIWQVKLWRNSSKPDWTLFNQWLFKIHICRNFECLSLSWFSCTLRLKRHPLNPVICAMTDNSLITERFLHVLELPKNFWQFESVGRGSKIDHAHF